MIQKRTHPLIIFLSIALTCIITGGIFGILTNMINGAVSPYYFRKVMHWDFPDIWPAAITEGLLKGLLYGIIFSLVFTCGFAIITKGDAAYGFGFRQLLKTVAFIAICWVVGGLFAILLISINPDFYRSLFPIAPKDEVEMLKFAWVGGSLWGGVIGGLLSSILGVMVTRNAWHELTDTEE
jgi:prolipoprotein diacylglyceryltransferase